MALRYARLRVHGARRIPAEKLAEGIRYAHASEVETGSDGSIQHLTLWISAPAIIARWTALGCRAEVVDDDVQREIDLYGRVVRV